ncbi:MAG TPA: PTS sugar transporter subunit IIA [Gemmataceae bacterium]|nr:PTS sugar transporter subunit IIA [Gemmataceae bacterium]
MTNEMMDMEQLAAYLQRDIREVGKLASRGHLPGHKVGGQWRFARAEINHWIETQLPAYTAKQLATLDSAGDGDGEPLLANLLSEASMAVPLPASTKVSVLRELVNLAEQSWQVYDPEAVLEAIRTREEMGSTALPSGVAIPHPRRPLPAALGESVLAYGRTASPLPFGAPSGGLTDIFFLVCCRDDRTHLRVLARLTRLLMRPEFLDELRAAETPGETWEIIAAAERQLLNP